MTEGLDATPECGNLSIPTQTQRSGGKHEWRPTSTICCIRRDAPARLDEHVLCGRTRSEGRRLQAAHNWGPVTPNGNQQAVLFGDPTKPGLYGVMTKWLAGNHFSRPHFHPNDRFITVLSGTWWVGSGPDFDPNTSGSHTGGIVRHPFWKASALGWRQRYRCSPSDSRGRPGHDNAFCAGNAYKPLNQL